MARNRATGPPKFGAPTISQIATSVEHSGYSRGRVPTPIPTISQIATSVEHEDQDEHPNQA